MKVTLFSKTPLAAAPWELYKALKKYTLVDASLVNVTNKYYDGRSFPYHLLWGAQNGQATRALQQAEIIHIHNYLATPADRFRNKKIIAQFHSVPRLGNWRALMTFADISYTISQPLHEKEYRLPGLPNIIDPDEYRPVLRKDPVKIAFAPTNRAPVGRLDSKGYHEVKRILDSVATKRGVEILWIEGKPYEENLRLKSQAHILVDDVVTGNWHRTSLEGACFGCAVMNRNSTVPFVHANLKNLEERLLWLIDDRGALEDLQERSRLWVLQKWHAMDLVKKYVAAYKGVLR